MMASKKLLFFAMTAITVLYGVSAQAMGPDFQGFSPDGVSAKTSAARDRAGTSSANPSSFQPSHSAGLSPSRGSRHQAQANDFAFASWNSPQHIGGLWRTDRVADFGFRDGLGSYQGLGFTGFGPCWNIPQYQRLYRWEGRCDGWRY